MCVRFFCETFGGFLDKIWGGIKRIWIFSISLPPVVCTLIDLDVVLTWRPLRLFVVRQKGARPAITQPNATSSARLRLTSPQAAAITESGIKLTSTQAALLPDAPPEARIFSLDWDGDKEVELSLVGGTRI